jgi:nitroreductase
MNVSDAIRQRRSVRSYLERPVEAEKLERVLDAGRRAPSARNMQEWKFVVVRDAPTRARLAEAACGQAFVGQAPVVLAACAIACGHVMTCGQHCYPIDLAIAVDHMTLQAVEEGLGTCWIGAFHEAKVKEILGIPAPVRVVALLPLGYPAQVPPPTARKPPEEIVAWERWT